MRKPNAKAKRFGFTLIEIMVVIFIISIITTVALLSFRFNENKQIENVTNELIQLITLAEQQAILQPKILGIRVTTHLLEFQNLAQENHKNKWQPLDDRILKIYPIPENIVLSIQTKKKIKGEAPQIVIAHNGDTNDFIIYVGKRGAAPRFAIIGEANGQVSKKDLS